MPSLSCTGTRGGCACILRTKREMGALRRGWAATLLLVCLFCLIPPAQALAADGAFTTQHRLGFRLGDDWEPALAADGSGHVYALYKHYPVPGGRGCSGCNLHLLLQRSDDGGGTWSAPVPIAPGPVMGGQHDSQIAVDPLDPRKVWASLMQHTNADIEVVRSVDRGKTWSPPVIVSTGPPNKDKDELAVRGDLAVVAYDDGRNTWASVTTDGGATWHVHLVFPHSKQFGISLAGSAVIDSAGRIFVTWDSFDRAHAANGDGQTTLWVSRSLDGGVTWDRTVVGISGTPPPCPGCGWDYLGPAMVMAVGRDDSLYTLWQASAPLAVGAPERIYLARSGDHGHSYSLPVDASDAPAGVEHSFPAIVAGLRPGSIGVGWMDTRTGSWNVFFRQSRDGGLTFGATKQVSSYVPGYPYLTPAGFGLPYGDYWSMAVGRDGEVDLAFGEGPNYAGPGNIWFARSSGM